MKTTTYSRAQTFQTYAVCSTICLFLATLAGAFTRLSPRFKLLPSYIFFFSFAAFSIMLFQSILTRSPERLRHLDLREQRGLLFTTVSVSALCVFSELTLIPWPKIPAGFLLATAVLYHGYRVWQGFELREIWQDVALRFFITDMLFLLVAAVGLFALGWKETWPDFALIPAFLRPSTVFLGASFPLTLTFTGYLCQFATQDGGLSRAEHQIFDWWYYLLVGGVLLFLVFILLNLRLAMQIMALILLLGVFAINLLFIPRLARNPRSVHLLFALVGLIGLLATSAAGNALIASNTPTIPAGANPILLSHVHYAQLGWVVISFWGIQYTLWPTLLHLDRGQVVWLPLGCNYPPAGRALAYLQLVLAAGGVILLSISHLTFDYTLMRASGIALALGVVLAPAILAQCKQHFSPGAENVI